MSKFSFDEAFEVLQEGKCIARESWDEGTFAFKQVSNIVPIENLRRVKSFPNAAKGIFAQRGKSLYFVNNLLLVYPDNRLCGWTPSIADIFASDWLIVQR